MCVPYKMKDICWIMDKTLFTQKKLAEVSRVSEALVSRRLQEEDSDMNYRYRLLWSYILDEHIRDGGILLLSRDDAQLVCEKVHDGSAVIAYYWRQRGLRG